MEKTVLILLLIICPAWAFSQKTISTIAVGSCSHEYDKDQMWPEIIQENPDLFIWTGDIVYGDTHDMKVLKKKYDQQKSHPDYQRLLQNTQVIGMWDDHDYGTNDGGKYYAKKKESKELLLDFLDVPANNRVRKHEGVYNTYSYGQNPNKVKVILLDSRYFRDTLDREMSEKRRYKPNLDGDILGSQQWTWFERELKNSDADLNIIISSIQVLSAEHGYEKWANFPVARKKLLDLITEVKPKPTFFVSGDRHIAELSKIDLEGLPYPLFDFTASGLTHSWGRVSEEKNALRVGKLTINKNFGVIQVDWQADQPKVTFLVKGNEGAEYMRHSFTY